MNLIIRADAGISMGTGHVMRCLALAQACRNAGGNSIFVMAETTSAIQVRLLREGMRVEPMTAQPGGEADARITVEIANTGRSPQSLESVGQSETGIPTWIVVDGYQFGASYQSAIRDAGCRFLFVDDNVHSGHYCADLVLNQNAHAGESLYANRESYTHLLLGPRYVLLRREFSQWKDWKREIREVGERILVVMGGSDPRNHTLQVIEALDLVRDRSLEVKAVVGGSSPHLAAIGQAAARSRHRIHLEKDASDMPGLMAWADLAISAAGTVCWEFCALGLPALLIPVASNQNNVAKSLEELGAAKRIATGHQFSHSQLAQKVDQIIALPEERRAMSERARALVDTRGAERVLNVLCRESPVEMEVR